MSGVISRNDKLTFGDLAIGDRFIGFPLPGDDSGHGGYKGTHWIYQKISKRKGLQDLVKDNTVVSSFPDTMLVLKVG